ncbi:hypothetical protein LCGC14_0412460 [marine sediment metagenome]|uniref:Uncharacterized protein n=1 Tax=marine sediment metagenome TaxID=412755 RepID=A0A0F9STM4_9ZZZZ
MAKTRKLLAQGDGVFQVLVDTDLVPADTTTDLDFTETIGRKADAAAAGAVTSTDSLLAYIKQVVTELIVVDGVADSILVDTGTTLPVTLADILTDTGTTLPATLATLAPIMGIPGAARAAAAATLLPNNTAASLFTISGGRVLLHAIIGEVTIVMTAQQTRVKLQVNPTTGTTTDLCIALDLTGHEQGALLSLPGAPGSALVAGESGNVQLPSTGIILAAGVLEIHHNDAVAGQTGQVKWDVVWSPYDVGATLA